MEEKVFSDLKLDDYVSASKKWHSNLKEWCSEVSAIVADDAIGEANVIEIDSLPSDIFGIEAPVSSKTPAVQNRGR